MGKGKQKNRIPSQRRASKLAPKKVHESVDSINAPAFDKNNSFQVALNNKDFELAKKILAESSKNMPEWRRLNLEGLITISQGDLVATERILLRSLRYPEVGVKPYKNLVSVYSQMGRLRDALPLAEKAHNMEPDSLEIGLLYINCLLDLAKADDVIRVADKLLIKNKNQRQLMLAKASGLRAGFRPDESTLLVDEILELYPNDATAMRLKADILGDKDSVAAVEIYNKAQAIVLKERKKPDIAMNWNSSLHHLRTRDFKKGWEYWELGFDKAVGTMGRNLIPQVKVLPRADLLDKFDPEKWTLICVEQGIGDQILFLSAMEDAIAEFKNLFFICEARMKPIISRSFPDLQVGLPGLLESWPLTSIEKNGFIPLGSLPGRYRPTIESFTNYKKSFIQVNGDLYVQYHKQLRDMAKGRPVVGISWKGGFWESQKKAKALGIENWFPIFERGALCVNLQYGNTSEDEQLIKDKGFEFVTFPQIDYKVKLDDWLAIAAACDGIISVSTALVHFAGACGQKVGIVMPEPQGPWILGIDDEWSIAYPNVAIFRRNREESVRDLVDRVAKVIVT
ncbi:MAG: hypothetical protein CBD16_07210 [Betaproteobacteria bacterium TMED156]|nr:MAG: hypothetical protein CBD16_07210 [Betaproteobacteria bacterium TMED156]